MRQVYVAIELYYNLQVLLPRGTNRLPRVFHSAVAIAQFPGVVEVIQFGGMTERLGFVSSKTVAETMIITFSMLLFG